MKNISGLLILLLISGCASAPRVVDLPDAVYSSAYTAKTTGNEIAKLIIENTASSAELNIPINPAASMHWPIDLNPATSQTVEQDIRRYFEQRFSYDSDSDRIIRVKIKQANAVLIEKRGAVMWVPIVGPFLTPKERTFVMNLDVVVVLVENGKQVAAYVYDESINVKGRIQKDYVMLFYKQLIETYRKKFFNELDEEFLPTIFQ